MTKLIVVIDDSLTIRKILSVYLRREGFHVEVFADGVAALRHFAQPEARIPNLILLAICLPKLDGFELLRLLKAKPRFAHTIFIMLTRRSGLLDQLKARLAGAKGYLIKPFQTQQLLETLQAHLSLTTIHEEEQGAILV